MPETIVISGNDESQRLDRFFRKRFPMIPLSMVYKLLRQEKVKIIRGGRKFHGKKETMLKKGDEVRLYFNPQSFGEAIPKKKPDYDFILRSRFFKTHFRILFEDEYLWAADKLPGIAVHPGTDTPWGRSLIDIFSAYQRSKHEELPEPKLVHRLDKDTSGIILISKNDAVLRKLSETMREKGFKKEYLTLVKGKLKNLKGVIEAPLERTEGSKYTKIRVSMNRGAKMSRTLYQVLGYFPDRDASLVRVTLDTGRMHQIRVHFSEGGNPVAGDDAYGDRTWNKFLKKKFGLNRQFLHAFRLAFLHPETEKEINLFSDLPADLKKILPPGKEVLYTSGASFKGD